MKTATLATVLCIAMLTGCGTQNPFGNDPAESTPQEDQVAIVTYTQTVNQTSQDTTIAPVVDGNNNTVIVIVGNDNAPTSNNTRNEPQEPEPEAEP